MFRKKDNDLQTAFLRVLQEADSERTASPLAVQQFSIHLAQFSEAWATHSSELEDYERWLENWVRQTRQEIRLRNDLISDRLRFDTLSDKLTYDDFDAGPALADADVD